MAKKTKVAGYHGARALLPEELVEAELLEQIPEFRRLSAETEGVSEEVLSQLSIQMMEAD